MIDLSNAKEEFLRYTNQFDINDFNIKRKISHSIRVMELCKNLATKLELDNEKIELLELIGLLHDIGRFEQWNLYNSYSDFETNTDHALMGIEVLEKDNYIRKYIKNDKYDNLIKKAIFNHNKYKIESNLTIDEIMFCNMIRDCDKTDIIYQATCIYWKDETIINNGKISDKVYEEMIEEKIIENKFKENQIDNLLGVLSFIFDMKYVEEIKVIKENNYINKIFSRFNFENEQTQKRMENVRKMLNEYVSKKLK